MKKHMTLLTVMLIILAFSACSSGWGEPTTVREGGGYRFDLTSGDMYFSEPGEQKLIQFMLKPKDIPTTWESSDENVATVDEYYVVTAVGSGECDITYTVGDKQSGITKGTFHVVCR